MLIFRDDGSIEYILHGVTVVVVPSGVLTQEQRDVLRPLVAKLRTDGRSQIRALLTAASAALV